MPKTTTKEKLLKIKAARQAQLDRGEYRNQHEMIVQIVAMAQIELIDALLLGE